MRLQLLRECHDNKNNIIVRYNASRRWMNNFRGVTYNEKA